MNPYLIKEKTCISFSGGRTSAYMLHKVLEANGGLPEDALVCFANTGKEDPATLDFVNDCSINWNVPIVWLEYEPENGFKVVDYESASRNGEPFESMIRKNNYLPNPVTRNCTYQLKIRCMNKYLRSIGWDYWDSFIGIRHDEPRRVAKIMANPRSDTSRATSILPLAHDNVTKETVAKFWASQNFDLKLPNRNGVTLHGNCDLCFLKSGRQVQSLIQERPDRALWWAKMESLELATKKDGDKFRNDRPSYLQMYNNALDQKQLDFSDESIECFCGD